LHTITNTQHANEAMREMLLVVQLKILCTFHNIKHSFHWFYSCKPWCPNQGNWYYLVTSKPGIDISPQPGKLCQQRIYNIPYNKSKWKTS